MSFVQDFKSFVSKGNVVDLAVGVIIGGAFGKIVSALVEDVFMPVLGMIAPGGKMFANQYVVLKPGKEGEVYQSLDDAKKAGANVFAYGHFIQTIVDFLIIAFSIFIMIRLIERLRRKHEAAAEPAAPAGPSATEVLLTEIRDELKKRN